MSGQRLTEVEIQGVSPEDFDYNDEHDEATELANKIHDILKEDYDLNPEGVVVKVR